MKKFKDYWPSEMMKYEAKKIQSLKNKRLGKKESHGGGN